MTFTEIYKTVGGVELSLMGLKPEGEDGTPKPGIVFYFGGGWMQGTMTHFERQARHFSQRGMHSFLVDYRVKSRHDTTPVESVQDARSAMRHVRRNAARLGVDPDRLVAAGGSAGGHLALCTELAAGVDEPGEDASVSSRPVAIIGFNPVCDTTARGFGNKLFRPDEWQRVNPIGLVHDDMPPVLLLHGDADTVVPIQQARELKQAITQAGGDCRLIEYPEQGHGFFNQGELYDRTLHEADAFLQKLGLLPEEERSAKLEAQST